MGQQDIMANMVLGIMAIEFIVSMLKSGPFSGFRRVTYQYTKKDASHAFLVFLKETRN